MKVAPSGCGALAQDLMVAVAGGAIPRQQPTKRGVRAAARVAAFVVGVLVVLCCLFVFECVALCVLLVVVMFLLFRLSLFHVFILLFV